jgi:hypothetical protein
MLRLVSWFYVHPARGVVQADERDFGASLAPVDWHPDGEDAQDQAEDEFLASLIEFFAGPDATFEADLPLPVDQDRLQRAASVAGVTLKARGHAVFAGPLHAGLAGAFPAMTQLVLSVRRGGVERLHVHDDVRQAFAWLDDHEASRLRSLLGSRGLLL